MKLKTLLKRFGFTLSRELLTVVCVSLTLMISTIILLWNESLTNLLHAYEGVAVSAIGISLLLCDCLFVIYMIRRNQQYKLSLDQHLKLEAALQKAQNHLELILRSGPAMVFSSEADNDFHMFYVSDNITRILGYSKEEALSHRFWINNVHTDDLPGIQEYILTLHENGYGRKEYRFRHKDGSWRWLVSEVKVLYSNLGSPSEFMGTFWDVTEQKLEQQAIEKANKRFELSYKATRNAIFDWDMVSNQVWSSDEMCTSFGYPKETTDTSFNWWKEHIHPDDVTDVVESITRTLAEKSDYWVKEYRFRKADGNYVNIFGNGYVIYSEQAQPVRWVGAMTDITIFKLTEAELRSAKEKAEDSMKAKSEFLANMSHEIRTPLNGIISMTEMTLHTDLSEEQNRYLSIVQKSSDTLLALINDILDFSKIDAGKLELSDDSFSLRDEMPKILQPLAFKASEKDIEFICKLEDTVPDLFIADLLRIEQIIVNLVSNALKFTHKGEISVRAQLKARSIESATVLFSVSDSGIGIAPDKVKLIFEDFQQADGSTTREYGGTGLGLAISKRLIEMMGGSIWVESEEGVGSTFYFTLEMKLQGSENERKMPSLEMEGARVLVVEDNRTSRETIGNMVEHLKMIPYGVDNGEEALAELVKANADARPFEVVLLDINLEGALNGFDVAEQIRNNPDLADTGIIVISMSQKESDRERFARLGVEHFFTKPFGLSTLFDSIQNVKSLTRKNKMYTYES